MDIDKDFWGILATLITIIASIPYMVSVARRNTKPHLFSWLIWTISTYVIFFAQLVDKGGAGAWSTGVAATFALIILVQAYVCKGDYRSSRMDWLCLIIALLAIPCWLVTSTPLYAVILLVGIDILAYLPTLRKAWVRPYEEQIFMYAVITLRNVISVIALEHYSLTTLLFPVLTSVANLLLIGIILLQRMKKAAS